MTSTGVSSNTSAEPPEADTVDMKLEVVTLPSASALPPMNRAPFGA